MSEHGGEEPDHDHDESGADGVDTDEASNGGSGGSADASSEPTIESAQAERDRMREQLLRIAADFDNFRKRSRKEVEEVRRRTIEDTLREVLPVIDNLERAAGAANDAVDAQAVADGVHMVLRGFDEVANRLGLERVKSLGETFDPTVHDAMQQQETDEHPPGTIVAEVVPGYRLGDRLLRPAMVVVARRPAGSSPPDSGANADSNGATGASSSE